MEEKNKKLYWTGIINVMIRLYFYAKRGLELLNEFRYYIMGVFALYYTLKCTNILMMGVIFMIGLPILICLGYISVHYMGKVIEFLNVEFSTHFNKLQVDYQKRTAEAVEEIKERLKNDRNT